MLKHTLKLIDICTASFSLESLLSELGLLNALKQVSWESSLKLQESVCVQQIIINIILVCKK